ncbi:ribonuclease P protein component [Planctomicrobium sp. SH527]|uniref:ribonuclease P protein component n=1 Tax=Planctomicrobium sp. SH527 TaxID=3448123 RepID=UPI003F5BA6D6
MCDRSLRQSDESAEHVQLTFPHHFRLRSSIDFARIYDLNQKASNPHLLIFAAINRLDYSRIGLSVSRRHGNSVRRHRLRRLLKEAFRLQQHEIPAGMDLILIPGRESKSATQQDFCDAIKQLASKLYERLLKTP